MTRLGKVLFEIRHFPIRNEPIPGSHPLVMIGQVSAVVDRLVRWVMGWQ